MGIIKMGNKDGFGDEFDWLDEFPEDDIFKDPNMPKPTCRMCDGGGTLENEAGDERSCWWCGGSGVDPY